ncbi:MAG: ROK family protein [Candidatus Omnitrophica bacterium]|nr:ROK family protein [Candidatus Omnitrophota bacterium]
MSLEKTSFIGIDVGATNTKIALISKQAFILSRSNFPTKFYQDKIALIKKILNEIHKILKPYKPSAKHIGGIGIGLPGLIDHSKGIVFSLTNIPGWKDVPLKRILERRLNLPVFIDNDVNVICLGEYLYGAGKGSRNVIAVSLGTGIGGGIIINGSLYRGASFSAGEIGHIMINENGPRCGCGRFGCLESYVGNYAIIRTAKEKLKKKTSKILKELTGGNFKNLTPEYLNLAARRGDSLAIEVWEDVGRYLGIGLSAIVNLLNPDRIVICGGVSKAGNLLLKPVLESLKEYSLDVPFRAVGIVFSKLGDDAGVIGASCLVNQGG